MRAVITHCDLWNLQSHGDDQLRHVFEDGDDGKGLLMESVCSARLPSPQFERSSDTTHDKTGASIPGLVALQAADLYAHEIFRNAKYGEDSRFVRTLRPLGGSEPRVFSIGNLEELKAHLTGDEDEWDKYSSLM